MVDVRFEHGHILYRSQPYPFGHEYMLLGSGVDTHGNPMFSSVKVFDELPWNYRNYKPIKDAVTVSRGYSWYSNGKSIFDKDYDHVLVREER